MAFVFLNFFLISVHKPVSQLLFKTLGRVIILVYSHSLPAFGHVFNFPLGSGKKRPRRTVGRRRRSRCGAGLLSRWPGGCPVDGVCRPCSLDAGGAWWRLSGRGRLGGAAGVTSLALRGLDTNAPRLPRGFRRSFFGRGLVHDKV